jgi:hypothetical protein
VVGAALVDGLPRNGLTSRLASLAGGRLVKSAGVIQLAGLLNESPRQTPETSKELSSKEKRKFKREKTSSKKISYRHKKKK